MHSVPFKSPLFKLQGAKLLGGFDIKGSIKMIIKQGGGFKKPDDLGKDGTREYYNVQGLKIYKYQAISEANCFD